MRTVDVAGSVVLGVVPSWAACGWALVRISPDGDGILQAGVIRTRTAYRTSEDATADLLRRGRALAGQLRVVASREPLAGVVRLSSDGAGELDQRVYGLLDSLASELDVPMYEDRRHRGATDLVTERCDMVRLVELLDDDEVAENLRRRAIDAVALVLTVAEREPKLIESRGLIRRAGGKT